MMQPMSIFGLIRTACLVSGVFACVAVAAAQAAPSDPDRFVASIYANGREGVVWAQWLDGSRRLEWFTQGLTTLWENCDALAHGTGDELGPVDFDAATNSQGWTSRALQSRHSRKMPRTRALSLGSRPTIGCVNRNERTRFATTSSGSADAGRWTTSIP
jgi:hypothetical protein